MSKKNRKRGNRRQRNRKRSQEKQQTASTPAARAPEEEGLYTGEPGGTRSLELLRERIEAAAREIHRLRQENADLADRIARLEQTQGQDLRTLLQVEAPPEQLEEKITGFIQAIDRYLSQHLTEQPEESRGAPEAPDHHA